MPNIAAVLKQEIARVARREARNQIETLRKSYAQQRRSIAELKRNVAALERRVATLGGSIEKAAPIAAADGESSQRVRFSSKGIRSLRRRLGLSAGDLARLVDVSAQSVYNWEREVTRPRPTQLKALAEIRGLGKREATTRLQALNGDGRKGASQPAET